MEQHLFLVGECHIHFIYLACGGKLSCFLSFFFPSCEGAERYFPCRPMVCIAQKSACSCPVYSFCCIDHRNYYCVPPGIACKEPPCWIRQEWPYRHTCAFRRCDEEL